MFKTKTKGASLPTQSIPISQFKERAGNLLNKIEGIHSDIEQNKLLRFKQLLSEITGVQQNVEEEVKHQKKLYDGLMDKIKNLSQQVEEEMHESQKTAKAIKNRMEQFSRANEKAFDKLKIDRQETQQRLQRYLESKLDDFMRKYPELSESCSGTAQSTPNENYLQLQKLRSEVGDYFLQCELEEQKMKQEIYSTIELCTTEVNASSRDVDSVEAQAIEYMRILHLEIEGRLAKIGEERIKMEEEVIDLLERVVAAMSRGIDSSKFGIYAREQKKTVDA